jgi:hypothetical protein
LRCLLDALRAFRLVARLPLALNSLDDFPLVFEHFAFRGGPAPRT